jgi:hypothetical protein
MKVRRLLLLVILFQIYRADPIIIAGPSYLLVSTSEGETLFPIFHTWTSPLPQNKEDEVLRKFVGKYYDKFKYNLESEMKTNDPSSCDIINIDEVKGNRLIFNLFLIYKTQATLGTSICKKKIPNIKLARLTTLIVFEKYLSTTIVPMF